VLELKPIELVEVEPVSNPHKVNLFKLIVLLGTNIETIRYGLQGANATMRDALFRILQ
jgi:hypothetical protein